MDPSPLGRGSVGSDPGVEPEVDQNQHRQRHDPEHRHQYRVSPSLSGIAFAAPHYRPSTPYRECRYRDMQGLAGGAAVPSFSSEGRPTPPDEQRDPSYQQDPPKDSGPDSDSLGDEPRGDHRENQRGVSAESQEGPLGKLSHGLASYPGRVCGSVPTEDRPALGPCFRRLRGST